MMKKMKKVPKEPSPSNSYASYGVDVRQRLKYQSLLQDYMELHKETEAKKNKLKKTKEKKMQLLAEVRYLRKKYKSLSKNPYQEIPVRLKQPSHRAPIPSPLGSITQSVNLLVPEAISSKEQNYRLSEDASVSVINSLSANPSQCQFKKQSHRTSSLFLKQSLDMFIPGDLLSQELKYQVKEASNTSSYTVLDQNKVSLMNEEEMDYQFEQDIPKMEKLKRFSMSGTGSNDVKLAICRGVRKNLNKVANRKISWQDQVALKG
ncbi:hypothetical protein Cni_G05003 [Canna indica]|uniref:Uncharacterized protein n=1 Tax=Canna indica TaxID=4628 RepID=A0AAQ3JWX2_9LILI|nr:hypothetical protein Cni_G05003 [Canna indica]